MNLIRYYLDLLNIFLSHLLYKKEGEGEERGIRDKIKKKRLRESFKDTNTQNVIGEVWVGGGGRVL